MRLYFYRLSRTDRKKRVCFIVCRSVRGFSHTARREHVTRDLHENDRSRKSSTKFNRRTSNVGTARSYFIDISRKSYCGIREYFSNIIPTLRRKEFVAFIPGNVRDFLVFFFFYQSTNDSEKTVM